MPTYEYACKACDEHLEVVQSFKDDPLTECPNCGGQLRKVFGAIGIAFKGSGFYRNDSRPQESKRGKDGDSKGEASKEKSDSKAGSAGEKAGDTPSQTSSDKSATSDKKPKSDSTSAASS
jgi:putative FmdB family regulatory protein